MDLAGRQVREQDAHLRLGFAYELDLTDTRQSSAVTCGRRCHPASMPGSCASHFAPRAPTQSLALVPLVGRADGEGSEGVTGLVMQALWRLGAQKNPITCSELAPPRS
jgi:hypothetical protein